MLLLFFIINFISLLFLKLVKSSFSNSKFVAIKLKKVKNIDFGFWFFKLEMKSNILLILQARNYTILVLKIETSFY